MGGVVLAVLRPTLRVVLVVLLVGVCLGVTGCSDFPLYSLLQGMTGFVAAIDLGGPVVNVASYPSWSEPYVYALSLGENSGQWEDTDDRVAVVDASDPRAPQVVRSVAAPASDTTYGERQLAIMQDFTGDWFLLVSGAELTIYDLIDPTNPVESATYPFNGHSMALESSSRVYLSAFNSLAVLDLSDGTSPTALGVYNDTQGRLSAVATWSNEVLCGVGGNGYVLLDVSDPGDITELAFHVAVQFVSDAHFLSESVLLLAESLGSLLVLDVSDPVAPSVISTTAFGRSFNTQPHIVGGYYRPTQTAFLVDAFAVHYASFYDFSSPKAYQSFAVPPGAGSGWTHGYRDIAPAPADFEPDQSGGRKHLLLAAGGQGLAVIEFQP